MPHCVHPVVPPPLRPARPSQRCQTPPGPPPHPPLSLDWGEGCPQTAQGTQGVPKLSPPTGGGFCCITLPCSRWRGPGQGGEHRVPPPEWGLASPHNGSLKTPNSWSDTHSTQRGGGSPAEPLIFMGQGGASDQPLGWGGHKRGLHIPRTHPNPADPRISSFHSEKRKGAGIGSASRTLPRPRQKREGTRAGSGGLP